MLGFPLQITTKKLTAELRSSGPDLPCNSNQPLIAHVQPFREIKRDNFR